MKACPVMLHQATVGLVKANTGEGREHRTPSPTPTTPYHPVSVLPSRVLRAAFTWHQCQADAGWN